MLNKHTIPWMTLGSESQFVVYLCCPVVQLDAKTQPVFRLYRNYYTRQLYLWLLSQRCGEADL
jgi:hypothetical protein